MKRRSIFRWLALTGVFSISRYYLDFGSGSFIIQAIIAALVGTGLILRTFWGRIMSFFSRPNAQNDEDE